MPVSPTPVGLTPVGLTPVSLTPAVTRRMEALRCPTRGTPGAVKGAPAASRRIENVRQASQRLFLPAANLRRVDAKTSGRSGRSS